MQKLALIIVLFITGILSAQEYEKGMQKALSLINENPTEATNLFERIAASDLDNWVPSYYAANMYIMSSFGITDEVTLKGKLDKAKEHLAFAEAASPNNPEIMVMKALMYTAWVSFDGMTYGMKLSPDINALYARASSMAPDNPRVLLNKAQWDIGSAKFFGQDTTPFCKDIERSLELFATFKPEKPFYPTWGKEQAEQALEDCKK